MRRLYIFLYSLLLFFLFLVLFFRPITAINEDLGRHILLGKVILTTSSIPLVNALSFTYHNFSYMPTSWLSEVVFYVITVLGGFSLLQIGAVSIVATACMVQLYVVKKRSISAILAASSLYLLLLSTRTEIRPEIFSMLFLSIFSSTLLFSHSLKKLLIILIPIQILWVNMHIYFIVGPLLVFLFMIGQVVKERRFRIDKKLAITFVGVCVASIVNPMGVKGALYPLFVFENYGLPIIENQSVIVLHSLFGSNAILLPFIIISIVLTIFIIGNKKTSPIDWLLVGVFGVLSFINYRNILLFVFTTFIPFTLVLEYVVGRGMKKFSYLPKHTFMMLYPLSLLMIVAMIVRAVEVNSVGFGVREYGKGSVDFLIRNAIKGPYFNDFDIGGYLSYRIYPQLVFVDNRPEAYPEELFQDVLLPMRKDPQLFEVLDQQYQFNAIIITHWDGVSQLDLLHRYLVNDSNFFPVYVDEYALVLVRNSPKNGELLKRRITKKNINIDQIKDIRQLVKYMFFFEKIGWSEKGREVFEKIRLSDPELCVFEDYPLVRKSNISYVPKEQLEKCKLI